MRQRMVTRTMTVKSMKALALNKETNQVFESEIFSTEGKDPQKIIDQINKNSQNSNIKYLHVISVSEEKVRYGIPEQKFLELAEVLPGKEDEKQGENS